MPLPLIALGAGVVALVSVVSAAVTLRQLRQPLDVMVIGQSRTGKTTLLNSWRGEWEDDPLRTARPVKIGTFEVPTKDKVLSFEKKFVFHKVKDISGLDESMRGFLDDVKAATVVVYLVNAVHLHEEATRKAERPHAAEWVRVVDDAGRIRRHCEKAERVVVGVTHTDLDPRWAALGPAAYLAEVTEQLAAVLAKIGEAGRTSVVAGSMLTEAGAAEFAEGIVENLL
ncbi:hypothetical protein [Lentzea sp. HUAS12]|uniref:hypothetical protein n=1 Tax=Lentzea sp. HUAS12 TaxID=2951806 RepID=UPI00209DE37D|nr:hypothetical protein [Lentzea sp. HUAS12]USX52728.1 hypothetical protein ND450_01130 [Lentzea sp. HUAS12]